MQMVPCIRKGKESGWYAWMVIDPRGVSFTALAEDSHIIWQASIPDGEDNAGFTHLRNDDWNITNIP